MDPQQRHLLTHAHRVVTASDMLASQSSVASTCGVFVGIGQLEYSYYCVEHGTPGGAYIATGSGHSVAAGRVSFVYGFQGISVAIDTACSSSLVSTHLLANSMRSDMEAHEDASDASRVGLSGGVNVTLSPHTTSMFVAANMLAEDGRCKTLDSSADGYVRGEGCGFALFGTTRSGSGGRGTSGPSRAGSCRLP